MKRLLACLPFCLQIIGGYKTFDGGENDSNSHIEQHYSGSASHSAVVQTLKGLLIIFIDPLTFFSYDGLFVNTCQIRIIFVSVG